MYIIFFCRWQRPFRRNYTGAWLSCQELQLDYACRNVPCWSCRTIWILWSCRLLTGCCLFWMDCSLHSEAFWQASDLQCPEPAVLIQGPSALPKTWLQLPHILPALLPPESSLGVLGLCQGLAASPAASFFCHSTAVLLKIAFQGCAPHSPSCGDATALRGRHHTQM